MYGIINYMQSYLKEKRNEFIWSLSQQGYNGSQIALIFNIPRSTVHDIIKKKPDNWSSPWVKVTR
jgi:predicted DNA-binding protein YlxM (UPF0122 family)